MSNVKFKGKSLKNLQALYSALLRSDHSPRYILNETDALLNEISKRERARLRKYEGKK